MFGVERRNINYSVAMIRKPKFMNIEGVYMSQEELDASIEVGDIIETDLGTKLKCISIQDGVPLFERV